MVYITFFAFYLQFLWVFFFLPPPNLGGPAPPSFSHFSFSFSTTEGVYSSLRRINRKAQGQSHDRWLPPYTSRLTIHP